MFVVLDSWGGAPGYGGNRPSAKKLCPSFRNVAGRLRGTHSTTRPLGTTEDTDIRQGEFCPGNTTFSTGHPWGGPPKISERICPKSIPISVAAGECQASGPGRGHRARAADFSPPLRGALMCLRPGGTTAGDDARNSYEMAMPFAHRMQRRQQPARWDIRCRPFGTEGPTGRQSIARGVSPWNWISAHIQPQRGDTARFVGTRRTGTTTPRSLF